MEKKTKPNNSPLKAKVENRLNNAYLHTITSKARHANYNHLMKQAFDIDYPSINYPKSQENDSQN